VTLSPAIEAKAAELNHDPVAIYRWVRNNVEWQPTWGAIQDADLTLSAKRGNAMDISSLLIALLRASGIPSRYVHGAIEVPTTEFKNWAGGFADSGAAADFAASGGIPIANVVSGGQITKHQLEHVWVEAAIDFHPSRGAKNRDADSWVAMDASYKQYNYLEGLDAVAISGIDPEQLAQNFINSGTVNSAESWVSGFDPAILEAAQTQAQSALEDYIANHLPDPTVGDVIGGRQTIVQEYPVLPSALPNRVIAVGVNQRCSFRYSRLHFGKPWANDYGI
jgi:transglutaminase-like putative cysteine protease